MEYHIVMESDREIPRMAATQRRPGGARQTPGGEAHAAKKRVGRPKDEPSTIVNVRLPLPLLARLDRYLDRLEVQTGLKANRGMIARRAIELFLETHEAVHPRRSPPPGGGLSPITRPRGTSGHGQIWLDEIFTCSTRS